VVSSVTVGARKRGLAAKRPVVRFVALFIVFATAFYGLTALPFFTDRIYPRILALTADASALVLRIFGEGAHANGSTLSSPRFALEILRGCDAVDVYGLFAAAVCAFPVRWSRKSVGVITGVLVLFLANLARLVGLYYVGCLAPTWFQAAHEDVGQTAFMVVAAVAWVLWVWWATRPAHHMREVRITPQVGGGG